MHAPDGMIEVTKDQFFAALYADKRDIMPQHRNPDFTTWEEQHSRKLWGWSSPGWKGGKPGEPKRWAIYPAAQAKRRYHCGPEAEAEAAFRASRCEVTA